MHINFFMPESQPTYLYANSGGTSGTIIINSQANIDNYLNATQQPPTAQGNVTYGQFTGTTATLQLTKLNISAFQAYTATTVPNTYYNKTQINSYSAATATAISGKVCDAGDTMTGKLTINNALSVSGIVSGNTCVISPIVCGTTCMCSPVIWGTTGFFTTVCSATVSISTCLCSNGTTKLIGATTGSTLFLTTTPPVATIQQPTLFYDTVSKQIDAKVLTGGTDNYFYNECAVKACCTSATCVKYLGYCPTTLAGRFSVDFNAVVGNLTAARCTFAQFNIDGVVQGQCFMDLFNVAGGAQSHSLTRDVTFTAGQHCFDIWYWNGTGSATCSCAVFGSVRAKRIC
jgi:hypothetical protein